MPGEIPGPRPIETEKPEGQFTLPQNDMALKLYKRYLDGEVKHGSPTRRVHFTETNYNALSELLPKIFENQLENIGSFVPPEGDGQILYSKISVNKLARELAGNVIQQPTEPKKVRRIFVYHTFFQPD